VANGQSLREILKQVVVDTAKETLAGSTAQSTTTRALKAKPDYMRDSWNNAGFNPLTRNGYTMVRFGMSDPGKYGFGVGGRTTCDDRYLAHVLTKEPYQSDDMNRCVALEAQFQQRAVDYDGAVRSDFPKPERVPQFREQVFGTGLPKKLFVRTSINQFLHVYRRPKGLIVDIAGLGSSRFLAGYIDGVQYTLKGPQVVNSWLDYSFPTEPQPNESIYGHVRLFLPATKADMDKLFGVGSMTDQRMAGYDSVYYTIHKVRDVGRTIPGERLVEVTLTIDRVEIGMDKPYRAPSASTRPEDWDPAAKIVWTSGMPVHE
jgi:hypothetical protein